MSEFDGIQDFEGWSDKLLELIDEAERVAEKSNWPPRKKVSRRLREFVRKSAPNTAQILELDRMQALIDASRFSQFLMRAEFNETALVEHGDLVRMLNR